MKKSCIFYITCQAHLRKSLKVISLFRLKTLSQRPKRPLKGDLAVNGLKTENGLKLAKDPPPRGGIALRDFADFLKTCELAMRSVEDLETIDKQHDNKQLVKVLPSWVHPKWGVRVRDYQMKYGDNKFPPFSEFAYFVTDIAEVKCLPVLASLGTNASVKESKPRICKGKTRPRRNNESSALATKVKE